MRTAILILFLLFVLFIPEVNAQQENSDNEARIEQMMRNRQYRDAVIYIDSLETTPQLQFLKAMCYKSLESYGDALTILTKLTNEDAANIRYNSEIADCYMSLYNWRKSADTYEFLTRLDSTNVYFETQYGNMLLKLGDYPEALKVYNSIYDKYALESVFKYKGECFENMNMNDSSMFYYREAWEVNDYDTYSLANYINLKIKAGALPEAMGMTDAFIEQDSTNRIINRLNAIAYYSTDMLYDDAASRFERCLRLGDNSVAVSKGLGMCYYFLRISDKAYPHLTRAYMADSTNLNNIYPLAEVCNELEKNEEAIKYYNMVLEKLLPKPAALYMNYKGLAEAYERNEQYDEAMTNYLQAVRYCHDEGKMNLYYTIGTMCADKAHNYKDAIYYYEKYKDQLTYLLRTSERTYKNPQPTVFLNAAGEDDVTDVETIKAEAKERIDEVTAKLASLDTRIAELRVLWNKKLDEELDSGSIYAPRVSDSKKNEVANITPDSVNNIPNKDEKAERDSMVAKLQEKGIFIEGF
ncbi:tetratricopeptide repeat protein [Dysgonomonas sp. 25]|uniref:tetratricopeptide repeat protein n=1 Tax=Dysgonomonas sp. 25 TaxID=2302933 RepID=UPI0013D41060|nr:tetratricopeptide repeat protein [Dysgonomonas sp. 25]NDV67644.1 tetratricopeptide repeat protein [Dysgonomonas sp. 25]